MIATNNIEDILKLDADVVFHTPKIHPPYTHNDEDICRLLASGKNVISISGQCNMMQDRVYVFDMLGFGCPMDSVDPNDPSWHPVEIHNGMFAEVIAQLVHRLVTTRSRRDRPCHVSATEDITITRV
ncbi:MAG: hypothetical protein IPG24_04465 [Leptospiraceae bacterium]|nr:hypothetical protein [Leptospiraceae bacterium]